MSDELNEANRLIGLEQGLAIYKIGLDRLREQDLNARVMENEKFKLLTETIKEGKRLESLPFVTLKKTDERGEFWIISGHHRTRAAKIAGLKSVFCLVDEGEITKDYIRSKQLAHNSLQGHDDPQLLQQIFEEIDDLNARIANGINPDELLRSMAGVKIDEIDFSYKTQLVSILFTASGFEDWQQVMSMVETSEEIYLADYKYFDKFVDTCRQVSKKENVRNITGILLKMCEIVKSYYKAQNSIKKMEAVKEKIGKQKLV